MADRQRYVIWGSSGHAKVLAELLHDLGAEVAALFDNNQAAQTIATGIPLFIGEEGFTRWCSTVNPSEYFGLVAIGGARGRDRLDIQARFLRHGLKAAAVFHPTAQVSPSARIGAGTQLLAHSLVAADSRIGEACILNHKASIDHECIIGNGVHLAPGVTLAGCVEVGDEVMLGTGSCVLPRIKIGAGTIIGAGSLVTHDIPAGVVAYGRPAKVMRPNSGEPMKGA
jgi:sugar O-acyltransferase (sialic acid O-acetyltransferase NeuD family)